MVLYGFGQCNATPQDSSFLRRVKWDTGKDVGIVVVKAALHVMNQENIMRKTNKHVPNQTGGMNNGKENNM